MGFVENDPYCQELLPERFGTGIPVFGDIGEFDPAQIPGEIDLIHGGFPCPDISAAGLGAGIEGERSGLWAEFIRCICLARPRYAIVENVDKIKDRGMGVVLGTLAFGGYDAEWDCISALSLGAIYHDPEADVWRFQHRNRFIALATLPDTDRERIWLQSERERGGFRSPFITDYGQEELLADTDRLGCKPQQEDSHRSQSDPPRGGPVMAHTDGEGQYRKGVRLFQGRSFEEIDVPAGCSKGVGQADAQHPRLEGHGAELQLCQDGQEVPAFGPDRDGILEKARKERKLDRFRERSYECWAAEPCVRCIPARTPTYMDEIRLCGNANPPQLFEYLGELVLEDARRRGLI